MATIQTMEETLSNLTSSYSLPGLDLDSIAKLQVETNPVYSSAINNCKTPEEKVDMSDKFISYYKVENKVMIENNINIIKSSIMTLESGVDNVKTTIIGITAATAPPTTLAATPMVSSLKTAVDGLQLVIISLLTAALAISFVLPDPIMLLISSVAGLYVLISNIPI